MLNDIPHNLIIKSAQKNYPVDFFPKLSLLVEQLSLIRNPIVIIDSNILHLYGAEFSTLTTSAPVFVVSANEETKSFEYVGNILAWLSDQKCTKSNHIVAIGGGIIQDLAAFCAGVFFRGLSWSFVPTTLLSMSDSCIGAKSGLNFRQSKNQIGLFNSPNRVYIAPNFLQTLSELEIKSGYGEILKLHITGGFEKFSELVSSLSTQNGSLLGQHTIRHIADSLLIKKQIIEIDEYEHGLRATLNYGHTFGHAIEAATEHAIPHGIAVGWGLDFENFLAMNSGKLAYSKYKSIKEFIRMSLSVEPFQGSTERILEFAKKDKKAVSSSEVNLILFTDEDKLQITKTRFDDQLKKQLDEYLLSEDPFRPRNIAKPH